MNQPNTPHWTEVAHSVGEEFAGRAASHDEGDTFVSLNYAALKEQRVFSAGIPQELGGGGASHRELADMLRTLAHYCGSTALALSMHQHLIAATIWRYRRGQGGEPLLKSVSEKQLVLVSTGAGDWLESNGSMTKTDGGYLVSAKKRFASQAPIGDVLVTSAPFEDAEGGWEVLHFPVPMTAPGVTLLNDWHTLGMRGTGSNTVELENVFVPETAIVVRRPRGAYHPVWNVVLTVAMPLIMSVYVGIAEKAAEIAIGHARRKKTANPLASYLIGEMNNDLVAAEVQLNDMLRITNNYDFEPIDRNGHEILTRKTNVANAAIRVVSKAMDIVGGEGFYRAFGLERLFRDIQGARYHPLPESAQLRFSGEFLLRD
ncbi:MAG TPA: acyl-CoA dehydrogenase family protein [Candidatus Eisenbacteria bacterium]|nr:acyl-CoA dehydrogenase family protein [Candidatus Eisenbacteria bacterium]